MINYVKKGKWFYNNNYNLCFVALCNLQTVYNNVLLVNQFQKETQFNEFQLWNNTIVIPYK